jgi:hypothetical protein
MKIFRSNWPICYSKPQNIDPNFSELFRVLVAEREFTHAIFSQSLLKNIFIVPKQDMLDLMAYKINECFERIYYGERGLQSELFKSHLISLIPYCYPRIGDRFFIPETSGHEARCCEYRVTQRLDFTIHKKLSPHHGYVLKNKKGNTLLVFMGTTFPSGNGFCSTLFSDFVPFLSVGKLPFSKSFHLLHAFFQNHDDVTLYGMSLGGAMVFHTMREFPEKVKQGYAISPPGLFTSDLFESQKKLTILTQQNDMIPKLGFFPTGDKVSLFYIKVHQKKNPLASHAQAFSNHKKCRIYSHQVMQENKKLLRKVSYLAHALISFLALGFILMGLGAIEGYKHVKDFMVEFKKNLASWMHLKQQDILLTRPLGS